jgi:hypothetical protein
MCDVKPVRKRADILKLLNSYVHKRVILTYVSAVQWVLSINVLPEDDPVWPKHVANNRMYFNDISTTF